MKPITALGGAAFGLALLLSTGRAQTDSNAAAAVPPGLLGRTYASVDLGVEKIRHVANAPNGIAPGLDLNLPINDGFDYQLGFAYDHAAHGAFKLSDSTLGSGVTAYYRTNHVAPFLTAGLGYDLQRTTDQGVATRDNHLLYDVAAGAEIPVRAFTTVRLAVASDNSFRRPHAGTLGYDIAANYWLNDVVGASVGAVIKQGRGGAYDTIVYMAGVRFSFD